jgi:peptide/nickel transport system permease protein
MIRRYPIPTRRAPQRPRYTARRRLPSSAVAAPALGFLVVVVLAVTFAPFLTPYDPLQTGVGQPLAPPNALHPAGTDLYGRDVFSRLLYGGRLSLGIGAAVVLLAGIPGTILGLVAGYRGHWIDRAVSWLVDVMLSFPSILLALMIVAALGPGVTNVVLAVGVAGIPSYTRLVRGQVLSVRRQPYIRAAVTVGARDLRILVRHVLPNVFGPIVVLATLDVGWAILNASALSFLGLGVQPPTPEWGAMLNEGRGYLRDAPWLTAAPGLAIALTVLAVNLLGDYLRDALDPRRR